jgi:rare lipoprotein A
VKSAAGPNGKAGRSIALAVLACALVLAGCAQSPSAEAKESGLAVAALAVPLPVPKPEASSETLALLTEPEIAESYVGLASWYGRRFHGRLTASGSPFDMAALTAAHPNLPFGSQVRVTNLTNGRVVIVTITDRGPFVKPRVIDLSRAAAERLGFVHDGLARVRLDVLANPSG